MNVQHVGLTTLDGLQLEAALHRAPENSRGTVVLAHGITVDMNEGGMFVRLAEQLAANGFDALRFSYRGHGQSGGTQAGATIAGEVLDLQAAVEHARHELPGPLSIIAASFGAVFAETKEAVEGYEDVVRALDKVSLDEGESMDLIARRCARLQEADDVNGAVQRDSGEPFPPS